MRSLEIQAGTSNECNKSTMGLLQGMLESQKEILQRLSSMETKNPVVRDNQIDNNSGNSDIELMPFSCTECSCTFTDINESISHKDTHTKENKSDKNNENEQNEQVSN